MSKYVTVWGYKALDHRLSSANMSNLVQRVSFVNNVDGNSIRILFDNSLSEEKLHLEKVL